MDTRDKSSDQFFFNLGTISAQSALKGPNSENINLWHWLTHLVLQSEFLEDYTQCHGYITPEVLIIMKFSSLAASDENLVKIIFLFQWLQNMSECGFSGAPSARSGQQEIKGLSVSRANWIRVGCLAEYIVLSETCGIQACRLRELRCILKLPVHGKHAAYPIDMLIGSLCFALLWLRNRWPFPCIYYTIVLSPQLDFLYW